MSYPRLLSFNATGGLLWGIGAGMLSYIAGNSYARIEKMAEAVSPWRSR